MPNYPYTYCHDYPEMLKEHMATGLSYESFAGLIKVSSTTLYNWEKRIPEWVQAKKEAKELCRLFWEKAGIEGMHRGGKDKPFQPAVWTFNMKNRFGWADKKEIDHKGELTTKKIIEEEKPAVSAGENPYETETENGTD
jgi:DNA-binding XRE family transcriptional regulator